MYYTLGAEDRLRNLRYQNLLKEKVVKARLRQKITWPTIRFACVPLNVKGLCTICKEDKVLPSHILTHITDTRDFMTTVFDKIAEVDSVSKLADFDKEQLQKTWIYYKKTFSFNYNKKSNKPVINNTN